MISRIFADWKRFERELQADQKRFSKAARDAVKVEGYRLYRELKKEIEAGTPGGQKFAPRSELSKRFVGETLVKSGSTWGMLMNPLWKLAPQVRYNVKDTENNFSAEIGFTSPPKKPVSRAWIRIAEKHQEGFNASAQAHTSWGEPIGHLLKTLGYQETSWSHGIYVPRKTTTSFHTPARPIIEPFIRAHQGEIFPNIRSNFERKMRGERI